MKRSKVGIDWLAVMVILFLVNHPSFAQVPSCTQLNFPSDGGTEVPVSTNFEWVASSRASGYVLRVGTSPGGIDIINNLDVNNVTEYDLPEDLPYAQTIYVAIIPYNFEGANGSCATITFTTETTDGLPQCTDVTFPTLGAQGVALSPTLEWNAAIGATGYLLTIGTTSGGNDVLDRFDVENVTHYTSPQLSEGETYYIAIVPYNEVGEASGCGIQRSFTTRDSAMEEVIPCTSLRSPVNGSTSVPESTMLVWNPVDSVTGYFLSVGTSPGADDLVADLNVGPVTSFTLDTGFPSNSAIYVRIVPFVGGQRAEGCIEESFRTQGPIFTGNELGIPRFFTPNNDGFNDVWKIGAVADIPIRTIFVFNRFGQMIAQMGRNDVWDGTYRGRRLPSDSYWYSVEFENAPPVQGYVLLKR